jgi:hypothetical protein
MRIAGVVVLRLTSVLASVSTVEAVNAGAYDGARWQAGSALTRMGIPSRYIDAGYEWFGYHSPDHGTSALLRPRLTMHGTST